MHKKMIRVHRKVYQAHALRQEDCGLDELWKAQCNCPYWHGVFGGIYLADIRTSTYGHLVEAEARADAIMHQKQPWLEWQTMDFDNDGFDELLIDSNVSSVYVSQNEGGSIFEWDIHSHSYNLMSTLARRPEAYHRVLTEPATGNKADDGSVVPSIHDSITVKDNSVSRFLVYDKYPKSSLIDHFLSLGTKLEDFATNSYEELGDFVDQPYETSVKKKGGGVVVSLRRVGVVRSRDGAMPFEVQKEIRLSAGQEKLQVRYQLRNQGNSPVEGVFGSEWNFNLLGGRHNEQAYYQVPELVLDDSHLDSTGELLGVDKIVLGNRYLGIQLELTTSPRIRLWHFPVESISNSEGGIERIYQSSCLMLLLPIDVPAGGIAEFDLTWAVKPPVAAA
jgi:alpha-amylase